MNEEIFSECHLLVMHAAVMSIVDEPNPSLRLAVSAHSATPLCSPRFGDGILSSFSGRQVAGSVKFKLAPDSIT
jgi:hypothetical protein